MTAILGAVARLVNPDLLRAHGHGAGLDEAFVFIVIAARLGAQPNRQHLPPQKEEQAENAEQRVEPELLYVRPEKEQKHEAAQQHGCSEQAHHEEFALRDGEASGGGAVVGVILARDEKIRRYRGWILQP